jgi:hypothetical protein
MWTLSHLPQVSFDQYHLLTNESSEFWNGLVQVLLYVMILYNVYMYTRMIIIRSAFYEVMQL